MLTIIMRQQIENCFHNNQNPEAFYDLIPTTFYQVNLDLNINEMKELQRLGPVFFNAGVPSDQQNELLYKYSEILRRLNQYRGIEFESSRQFFLFLLIILEISINQWDENLTLDNYISKFNEILQ